MGEDTDQTQTVPTRRKMIKLAFGTVASAFVLPGIAAADDTSEHKRQEQEKGQPLNRFEPERTLRWGKNGMRSG
jgi:hypothetical protein